MSKKKKKDIDELLSEYVDGQLSDRQYNEVRRLAQHDEEIAEQLAKLKKQKELLTLLPVESAPSTMVDDVRSAMERKLILDEYEKTARSSGGGRVRFARRLLTTAAMWLIPVGLLGWVLFNIVMPTSDSKKNFAGGQGVDPAPKIVNPAPDTVTGRVDAPSTGFYESLCSGVLTLDSDQGITVNDYVNKKIFANGLLDSTVVQQTDNVRSYHIECPAANIIALLEDLRPIWPKCDSSSLTVHGPDMNSNVQIADVSVSQAMGVFREKSALQRIWAAADYATANHLAKAIVYQDILSPSLSETENVLATRPSIAQTPPPISIETKGPQASLVITVRSY